MNKVENAIAFAVKAHAGAKRKGKDRPYILHPLEAMIIVGSLTEDENVLAAAVLHDTVEDTGVTLEEISREFGPETAFLVRAESEDKRAGQSEEATWKVSKQETIDHLEAVAAADDERSRNILRICLGDKLSNLRELARDHEILGDSLWERFNQKDKAMHAWYYGSILRVLQKGLGGIDPVKEYQDLMIRVFEA